MFTIPGYFCLLSLKAELTHLRLTLGRGREEPGQEQNCFFSRVISNLGVSWEGARG